MGRPQRTISPVARQNLDDPSRDLIPDLRQRLALHPAHGLLREDADARVQVGVPEHVANQARHTQPKVEHPHSTLARPSRVKDRNLHRRRLPFGERRSVRQQGEQRRRRRDDAEVNVGRRALKEGADVAGHAQAGRAPDPERRVPGKFLVEDLFERPAQALVVPDGVELWEVEALTTRQLGQDPCRL